MILLVKRPQSGNGIIEEDAREDQRKIIRYNHLVANLVVFHNVDQLEHLNKELRFPE